MPFYDTENGEPCQCDGCRAARDETLELMDCTRCVVGQIVEDGLCELCLRRRERDNVRRWESDHRNRFSYDREVKTDRIKSRRLFGIELETASCPGYSSFETPEVSAKGDGSISGMEFVTIPMRGDESLDVIERWLVSIPKTWRVDRRCGYHLHIDMNTMADAERYSVVAAYAASARFWQKLVPLSRRNSEYCNFNLPFSIGTIAEIANRRRYSGFVQDYGRYYWVNVSAFSRHRTIENRIHTGTLERKKIVNWIIANLRFVEWAVKHTVEDIQTALVTPYDAIRAFRAREERLPDVSLSKMLKVISGEAWRDVELTQYYRRRAERFGVLFETA